MQHADAYDVLFCFYSSYFYPCAYRHKKQTLARGCERTQWEHLDQDKIHNHLCRQLKYISDLNPIPAQNRAPSITNTAFQPLGFPLPRVTGRRRSSRSWVHVRLDAAHYLTTTLLLRIHEWCAAWRRLVDLSCEMDKCQNDYGMAMLSTVPQRRLDTNFDHQSHR